MVKIPELGSGRVAQCKSTVRMPLLFIPFWPCNPVAQRPLVFFFAFCPQTLGLLPVAQYGCHCSSCVLFASRCSLSLVDTCTAIPAVSDSLAQQNLSSFRLAASFVSCQLCTVLACSRAQTLPSCLSGRLPLCWSSLWPCLKCVLAWLVQRALNHGAKATQPDWP